MIRNCVLKTISNKLDSNQRMTAIFYARTATSNDKQKDGCDSQVAMCNAFMKQHPNLVLIELPYVDKGFSGNGVINRFSYQKMIERIKKGDVDLLIVNEITRLCRSKSITLSLEELMRDYNFSILTLFDGQIYDYIDCSRSKISLDLIAIQEVIFRINDNQCTSKANNQIERRFYE